MLAPAALRIAAEIGDDVIGAGPLAGARPTGADALVIATAAAMNGQRRNAGSGFLVLDWTAARCDQLAAVRDAASGPPYVAVEAPPDTSTAIARISPTAPAIARRVLTARTRNSPT